MPLRSPTDSAAPVTDPPSGSRAESSRPDSLADAPGPEPLKSSVADLLDVHGGYVLLAAGGGLIAVACLFAGRPEVAPTFAVFGAILLILGAFYSRIEGSVEATKDGVRAVVRAAQRQAREQSIPDEAFPALLDETAAAFKPQDTPVG